MADVNIQQSPRSSSAVWAIVALVIVLLAVWFFFMRGGAARDVNVEINAPAGGAAGSGGGTPTP